MTPAQLILNNMARLETPADVIRRVVDEICAEYGTNRTELRGECRTRTLVDARRRVALRLYRDFGFSMVGIGKVLNREHSSVFNLLWPKARPRKVTDIIREAPLG